MSKWNVSVQTVRKVLKAAGLEAQAKMKKPLLRHKNVHAHLRCAEVHKNWIVEDWKHMIFMDKTKIKHFSSDGCT
jgi:hypothetical protein